MLCRSAIVIGEGQLRALLQTPQSGGAPLPRQLPSAACFRVQIVFPPGSRPGCSMFVALYSCVIHNTPEAGQAIIQFPLPLSRAPLLLPVCKLEG